MALEAKLGGLLVLLLALQGPGLARGGEADVARALRSDGPVYFVGALVPVYEQADPSLPPLEELQEVELQLGRTVDGYVAPRNHVRTIVFRLPQLAAASTQRFYGSALRHVNQQIVAWLNRRGVRGVRVRPHPEDIEPGTNRDLRPREEARLRLLISTGEARPREQAAGEPAGGFRIRALESDGPAYPIDRLIPVFAEPHPAHPSLRGLERFTFVLGRTADGYVAPRPGVQQVRFRLSQLAAAPTQKIHASGVRALDQQMVSWLSAQGLTGVLVRPHEADIEPGTGTDLRAEGREDLRLLIWTGHVNEIRTFASGKRVDPGQRVDNPVHEVIKDHSPIKPGALRGQDLVRKDELDAYAARLNRHPGRRVDVALSPGREPGSVYLDYLVAENKPWTAYAQWSNTGTRETTRARQRFGFTHTQLTGRDDILRLEYLTGDFDRVHGLTASYEAPFPGSERLRWSLDGSGSFYDSDISGLPGLKIKGGQWGIGGELVGNVLQHGELFLDLLAGLRWEQIRINSDLASGAEEEGFLLPRVGAQLERRTQTSSLFSRVVLEMNDSGISGNRWNDPPGTSHLARLDPDDDWAVLRWSSAFSTYLEPLLDRAAWEDPSTPASSTLAHEIALTFRGQYAFGNRLIPQEQMVAGGFYTVRGYPEAATELPDASGAGDSVLIGSLEYRLHLPRLFRPRQEAWRLPLIGEFRITPQRVYGFPDWDLILRGFLDGARILRHDRAASERNVTLLSAGLGAEVQLWRNIIARADLGFVLHPSRFLGVDRGDTEAHLSITTLY